MSLRTHISLTGPLLAVLPLLVACGRSELFGEVNGGFAALASGGLVGTGGSGFGRSGASAGGESNGTEGSGATGAGQGVGGFSSGSMSDVGGFTSGGGPPTGAGTSAGFTAGTGGSSGTASSGRSNGTGGTGSTSTGGFGTTTGPSCSKTKLENDRTVCKVDSDCGCPDTCVSDPPFGLHCEPPCLQLSDCTNPSYVCNGTYCQFDTCGPGTGNGTFNSFCDVAGTNDGTCIPFTQNGETFGECTQGGTSTTCCNMDATRTGAGNSGLDGICVAGSICSDGADDSGECGEICDPTQRRQCPRGLFCAFEVGDAITGGCFPPPPTSFCPSNH